MLVLAALLLGLAATWAWRRRTRSAVAAHVHLHTLPPAASLAPSPSRPVEHTAGHELESRIALAVQHHVREAVYVTGPDFNFIAVNPAFTALTGYQPDEVIGRNARMLDNPHHDSAFYDAMRADTAEHGYWTGEFWARRKDGEEFLCAAILFTDAPSRHVVALLTDVTHQRRTEQELRYLSNFDILTNLPNRTLLSERLSRAIVQARRGHGRIAVLSIDLDHFKDINDALGHAAGDRILRSAAMRLQETLGAQAIVARVGGDEFTMIVEGLETANHADQLARDIIVAFDAPLLLDNREEVSISPSIGISLYPDHGQVPTDLLKRADSAMYQAKIAGRRTFVRYDNTLEETLRERAIMVSALRKVLDRDELHLAFQPRLSLREQRIVGIEALLRWNSSELGEIPSSVFIPLAEENGMIQELGEWALRRACTTLQAWREEGITDVSMAVNVSALQLLRGDFPGVLQRVLAETGLPAQSLELELTESVVMTNAGTTAATLQALRNLGVSLAIDDFGTGYSSLAYLRRLPITTLKIDKEFIADLGTDPDDASITTTIIAMGHALGLSVVAEGVETPEQLQFLETHGCDEIQGFWLARPMPADTCVRFLREWPSSHAAAARNPALDRPVHPA